MLKHIPNIRVGISLSTMDQTLAKRIEKNVALPEERIRTIHELRQNGIEVYVFISPIFPILLGWREVVEAVGDQVDMVCFENLNLRSNYRLDVFAMIQEYYPEIYKEFTKLYSDAVKLKKYWENEAVQIKAYMKNKPYKLYFFHEEIRKD